MILWGGTKLTDDFFIYKFSRSECCEVAGESCDDVFGKVIDGYQNISLTMLGCSQGSSDVDVDYFEWFGSDYWLEMSLWSSGRVFEFLTGDALRYEPCYVLRHKWPVVKLLCSFEGLVATEMPRQWMRMSVGGGCFS